MARIGDLFKRSKIDHVQYILNSRVLLYFILFLAVVDLYIFAVNGQILFVSIFVIIGFLTSFFSKNMTVILFVAMVMTNILRFGKGVRLDDQSTNTYEGLEDMMGDMDAANHAQSDEPLENMDNKININTHIDEDQNLEGGDEEYLQPSSIKSTFKSSEEQNREEIKKLLLDSVIEKKLETLQKASKPTTTTIQPRPTAKKSANAADGIKKRMDDLDIDTINLLEKQKKIMENMENLHPLFEKAEKFLDRFNVSSNDR